jgi:hypothetical protein
MSRESLNQISAALQAYDAGLRLIESLDLLAVAAKDEKTPSAAFKEYRELWRWVERLLRRRCVIASRRLCVTLCFVWRYLLISNSPVDGAISYLNTYRNYALKWSPGFRPYGCGTVLSLQLRALCLHPPFPPPTSLSINNNSARSISSSRTAWHRDAQDCAQYYQKVLETHITFPRAGERNDVVNDFVDMCMAIWERGGCMESEAAWVTEVSSIRWRLPDIPSHSGVSIMHNIDNVVGYKINVPFAAYPTTPYPSSSRERRICGCQADILTLCPAGHQGATNISRRRIFTTEEEASQPARGAPRCHC